MVFTLNQIIKYINSNKCQCVSCTHPLRGSQLDHYPHTGGVAIQGFRKKLWLYWVCPNCGYQNSFVKLVAQVDRRKLNNGKKE